jgi:hypothetical protein
MEVSCQIHNPAALSKGKETQYLLKRRFGGLQETRLTLIIFINCNWVDTRWQWLFYMYKNMKLVTTKFKSGGLNEKHVVATWQFGIHLSICF